MSPSDRSPRHRTFLAGLIIHGPSRLTADCAVRNQSEGGAQVRLSAVVHLTPPIILVIPKLEVAYEARVAWQRGSDLGLKLVHQLDLLSPSTDLERLAHALLIERKPR
jgi:hypothetical protein